MWPSRQMVSDLTSWWSWSQLICPPGISTFYWQFLYWCCSPQSCCSCGIRACGTVRSNRSGFPRELRNVKAWEKCANRGDSRYHRDGDILTIQWKDNKLVSIMSTFHSASTCERRSKDRNGQFVRLTIPQEYNASMRGVDRSDQLINKYKSLRKTNKWWKTVFFHLIDVCRVNSYILFLEFRKQVILTLFVAMTAFIVCITYPPLRSSDKKNKNILPIFSFFLIFTAPEFKI